MHRRFHSLHMWRLIGVALVVAAIGMYVLQRSKAAPFAVAIEAEQGAKSSAILPIPDSNASSGNAIRFSNGSTSFTPPLECVRCRIHSTA